ncbi:HutD/Ves family protein [Archangium lansingense]|uniref:HutD family protein n=1 Tax=Archangium lansingense TaxID=2995310 RepID=A0ABT4AKX0_9BACT|nr:HutD family protein [Archangium lansinium]MCY1082343.1 HutD family protein [Archangium lansinium]
MMRRLGPADYRDMPWKNGGGVTRELLKLPHPSDPARFLARLSIATVGESGPFSLFPGIERTLMLLDGAGMALTLGGAREVVLDRRYQPFVFPGEAETHCRLLGGPVRDFNLMVDRAQAEGSLEVVHLAPGETRTLAGAATVVLHVLEGRAAVAGTPLAAEEMLWLEAPGSLALRSDEGAVLAAILLSPRSLAP